MKIATWNVCLGLTTKKDEISRTLIQNNIDICCIQEADIPINFPINDLTISGYSIEVEINEFKLRTCMYIKNGINYKRRMDLESNNNHIVIIDIMDSKTYRLINLYRVFNTFSQISPYDKFKHQLECIKKANCKNMIVVGDFNLNEDKRYSINYQCWKYFEQMNNLFDTMSLIQLVKFPTWIRHINGSIKSSTLDHIYTNDSTIILKINSLMPHLGDHLIITFLIDEKVVTPEPNWRRNWKNYDTRVLNEKLANENWQFEADSVQDYWNLLEDKLINIVDELIPYELAVNNKHQPVKGLNYINNKLNKLKRLLKIFNKNKTTEHKDKIKILDKEIRQYYYQKKKNSVRSKIIPNNTKSLWDAVRIAKDLNIQNLPDKMQAPNGDYIGKDNLPEAFAEFFKNKVENILTETMIDDSIYNGRQKIIPDETCFMSKEDITECFKTLKLKNTEGYDRIPQRILKDGIDHLIQPYYILMNKIYNQKTIPEQWSISKIIPTHKKEDKSKIENYRPISNLCSSSKVFEKLIMKRINNIQESQMVDLTGNAQHGFKKCRSTATAGLTVQSILSRSMDNNEYAMMSSLDLSAAFDVVNIELLLKRLKILGMPINLIDLIRAWLSERKYYVTVNGKCSMFYDLQSGIIQGSILGPFLYSIYMSPLFDISELTSFADDNYIIRCHSNITQLKEDMSYHLEQIITWLKGSGLKVNQNKTEICIFHKNSCEVSNIMVDGTIVQTSDSINVLGVEFDSKLQWSKHISKTIKKAYKSLHAIKIIKKFFNKNELNMLITSNFYSILYYNSEIWHLPTLNTKLKSNIRTASANALKICTPNYNYLMSYDFIHKENNRAQPNQMLQYKLALMLYKIVRDEIPSREWLALNHEQLFTSRQKNCIITSTSNYKVGFNIPTRRLTLINNKINLEWLNLSFDGFKVKCKKLFL